MINKFIASISVIMLLVLFLAGCQEQKDVQTQGEVKSNKAYQDNFGPPPTVQAGQAYARVGYLPTKENPGFLQPIPIYLLDGNDQLKKILTRLTSGEIVLPPESPLFQPFPEGMTIDVANSEEGTVSISLNQLPSSINDQEMATIALALSQTAIQFPDIEKVRILANGAPLSLMPEDGFSSQPNKILEVSPPEAIMIAGMWEKGEQHLSEILIDFDRPIQVNEAQLYNASGEKVTGDYFISSFDMAIVVHPKNPENYQEGTILKAQWSVTDKMGRKNTGTTVLPLRRYEH